MAVDAGLCSAGALVSRVILGLAAEIAAVAAEIAAGAVDTGFYVSHTK
jgi:hypothetical protein